MFKNIPPEGTARNLARYIGESKHPKVRLIVTIESGGWKIQTAPFLYSGQPQSKYIRTEPITTHRH